MGERAQRVNSTRSGTGRCLTAGVTVSQLVHMNGNSPTIIQATVETGDSEDNSREVAGGGANQTTSANDAGPFRSKSLHIAILSKDQQ